LKQWRANGIDPDSAPDEFEFYDKAMLALRFI
jgi:hypothetical protein